MMSSIRGILMRKCGCGSDEGLDLPLLLPRSLLVVSVSLRLRRTCWPTPTFSYVINTRPYHTISPIIDSLFLSSLYFCLYLLSIQLGRSMIVFQIAEFPLWSAAVMTEELSGSSITTDLHRFQFFSLPGIQIDWTDERFMDTEVPVMSGTVDADKDTIADGSPCWVLGIAVEACLKDSSENTRAIWWH